MLFRRVDVTRLGKAHDNYDSVLLLYSTLDKVRHLQEKVVSGDIPNILKIFQTLQQFPTGLSFWLFSVLSSFPSISGSIVNTSDSPEMEHDQMQTKLGHTLGLPVSLPPEPRSWITDNMQRRSKALNVCCLYVTDLLPPLSLPLLDKPLHLFSNSGLQRPWAMEDSELAILSENWPYKLLAPAKVQLEYLSHTQEQKAATASLYEGKEISSYNFDPTKLQSQANVQQVLLQLGLSRTARDWLDSRWSVQWSNSWSIGDDGDSRKRMLFQWYLLLLGNIYHLYENERRKRKLPLPAGEDMKAGVERHVPFEFTTCLAHVEITERMSNGEVSRIVGHFTHNEGCKSALLKRLPAVPLHDHVYKIALDQLENGANITTIQRCNHEMMEKVEDMELMSAKSLSTMFMIGWIPRHQIFSPESVKQSFIIQQEEVQSLHINTRDEESGLELLLFIALAQDENRKGIPLAFFLFSAPTGNQATHAGYNTEILQELLSRWQEYLSQNSESNMAFVPSVAITDTDTKECGALAQVWVGIILLLCKFHLWQCWTNHHKTAMHCKATDFWKEHVHRKAGQRSGSTQVTLPTAPDHLPTRIPGDPGLEFSVGDSHPQRSRINKRLTSKAATGPSNWVSVILEIGKSSVNYKLFNTKLHSIAHLLSTLPTHLTLNTRLSTRSELDTSNTSDSESGPASESEEVDDQDGDKASGTSVTSHDPPIPSTPSLEQSQSMASIASQALAVGSTHTAEDKCRTKFDEHFNAAESTNEEVLEKQMVTWTSPVYQHFKMPPAIIIKKGVVVYVMIEMYTNFS
ncbi:hypothetical protein BYT27DRAFT_7303366 [Phlegmacium glaucopus]|nr:hypothetical protein BYT27DRAFT_7303366 [Phlegmacium glaucopus]